MNQETKRMFAIPFVNLVALTAMIIFGWNGIAIVFLGQLIYHLLFSVKTAALADVTLLLTVLPLVGMKCFVSGCSPGSFLLDITTLSLVLGSLNWLRETVLQNAVYGQGVRSL